MKIHHITVFLEENTHIEKGSDNDILRIDDLTIFMGNIANANKLNQVAQQILRGMEEDEKNRLALKEASIAVKP